MACVRQLGERDIIVGPKSHAQLVIDVFLKKHEPIPDPVGQHLPRVVDDFFERNWVLDESAERIVGAQRTPGYRGALKSWLLLLRAFDKPGHSPPAAGVPCQNLILPATVVPGHGDPQRAMSMQPVVQGADRRSARPGRAQANTKAAAGSGQLDEAQIQNGESAELGAADRAVPGKCKRTSVPDSPAAECGALLGTGAETVEIAEVAAMIAEHLGIAAGAPVLKVDRIIRSRDDIPLEWRVAYCHPQSAKYMADLQ